MGAMTSPGTTTQPAATPGQGPYARAYRRSLEDPAGFWGEAAAGVDWITAPKRVLDDDTPPFYRWYPDGVLNTCYNALDRHVVGGRADQAALVYDSPLAGTVRSYSYADLLELVARFAGVLRALGVEQGGDEVPQRLAGAGPRLHEQVGARAQRVGDRLGHLHLARALLAAQGRDGGREDVADGR